MYRITYALGDLKAKPQQGFSRREGSALRHPNAAQASRGLQGATVRPSFVGEAPPAGYDSPGDVMGALMSALVETDVLYLKAHPEIPPVYASGVSFAEEPQGYQKLGEENWQDVPTCLGLRRGGNRDLVAWRCAELRTRSGVQAMPLVLSERTWSGMTRYRVVVMLPDGSVEDPARGGGARDVPRDHRVAFVLDLFNGPHEATLSNDTLQVLLDALADVDGRYLAAHPEAPLLYRAGIRYQEEPPGQEDWQDVRTTLRMGNGDCLPLTTKVVRRRAFPPTIGAAGGAPVPPAPGSVEERLLGAFGWGSRDELVPIGRVVPGDRIRGDGGGWTVVKAAAATGDKPILAFQLSNREVVRVSPGHRMILHDHSEKRAEMLRPGNQLRSGSGERIAVQWVLEQPAEACCDLTTDTGRFYLPESDVVVHNCEDLACWRVAELRVRFGIGARPTYTSQVRPDGSYLYHILVELPDGSIEDPSRNLGMR